MGGAGGDVGSRIEALNQEHTLSSKERVSLQEQIGVTAVTEQRGLIHRFSDWWALHQKQLLLWEAKQQAESAAAAFLARHKTLEAPSDANQARAPATAEPARGGEASKKLARASREKSDGDFKAA